MYRNDSTNQVLASVKFVTEEDAQKEKSHLRHSFWNNWMRHLSPQQETEKHLKLVQVIYFSNHLGIYTGNKMQRK